MRRKRRLFACVICFLVLCFSAVPAYADSACTLSLETETDNTTGEAMVRVSIAAGGEVTMLQFNIGFDTEKMKLKELSAGDVFENAAAPTLNTLGSSIYFVWDSLTPLSKDGTLLNLVFEFPSNAADNGSVWIDFDHEVLAANEDFQVLDIQCINDSVSVSTPIASETTTETEKTDWGAKSGYNNGLTLNKNELILPPGTSETLVISEKESNVLWTSSNEAAVEVENGVLTAGVGGNAIITVMTEDGTKEATCVVTVAKEQMTEQQDVAMDKKSGIGTIGWIGIAVGVALVVLSGCIIIIRQRKKTSQLRCKRDTIEQTDERGNE